MSTETSTGRRMTEAEHSERVRRLNDDLPMLEDADGAEAFRAGWSAAATTPPTPTATRTATPVNLTESEQDAAMESLTEAAEIRGLWTRAERLAEAQVHATLAVAAATFAHGARSEDGRVWNFINADAFTGSERADEVGA